MMFKGRTIESRLDLAVKEWDGAGAEESLPMPPEGASIREIKAAQRQVDEKENRLFHERLPSDERASILSAQNAHAQEVQAFDQSMHPHSQIEGIYLEQVVPA